MGARQGMVESQALHWTDVGWNPGAAISGVCCGTSYLTSVSSVPSQ